MGLCGLAPERPRPWPPVEVARILGDGAGWQLSYLPRRDPHRPSDAVLLDLADADDALVGAWGMLAARLGMTDAPALIDRLTLTFPDSALDDPWWTLYLGRGSID